MKLHFVLKVLKNERFVNSVFVFLIINSCPGQENNFLGSGIFELFLNTNTNYYEKNLSGFGHLRRFVRSFL